MSTVTAVITITREVRTSLARHYSLRSQLAWDEYFNGSQRFFSACTGCVAKLGSPNNPLLVIPAKAGIQFFELIAEELDPSLRWDDEYFKVSQRFPACTGCIAKAKKKARLPGPLVDSPANSLSGCDAAHQRQFWT